MGDARKELAGKDGQSQSCQLPTQVLEAETLPVPLHPILHRYSPMLKPRPARIPDTRERTPGSFCTRQLSRWRLNGSVLGGGVLYRMLVTASSALAARGWLMVARWAKRRDGRCILSGGVSVRSPSFRHAGQARESEKRRSADSTRSPLLRTRPNSQSRALVESSIDLGGAGALSAARAAVVENARTAGARRACLNASMVVG